jgi:hypothetical protein
MARKALQTVIDHHLAIYQTFVGLIGIVGSLRILFAFSWPLCLEYGVVTLAAFLTGQALVDLASRKLGGRSRRTLD